MNRGTETKIERAKVEILRLLIFYHSLDVENRGMGFRAIFRALKERPPEVRLGSFSTLKRCLDEMVQEHLIMKDPVKGTYHVLVDYVRFQEKLLTRDILERAKIYAGDEMRYPEKSPRPHSFHDPTGGITPFFINSIYLVANLEQLFGITETDRPAGVLVLPSHIGAETDTIPDLVPSWNVAATKMNLKTSMDHWLHEIVKFAKQNKLDLLMRGSEISLDALDKLWSVLFQGVEWILLTELLNPQRLLLWLKTPEGQARLKSLLTDERKEPS